AEAVAEAAIDPGRIVLEFTSLERLGNPRQLAEVRRLANRYGFRIAADNFGTGEAGLKRLAVLQPEFVKLDRELISGIGRSRRRQAMVLGILATCRSLDIEPIATGVETLDEIEWLQDAGIDRFQGYYFARPQLEDQLEDGIAEPVFSRDEAGFSACAA
ncbi:MAG: EAL domain-containing protein, partial [Wenzhouxiangella sp.]